MDYIRVVAKGSRLYKHLFTNRATIIDDLDGNIDVIPVDDDCVVCDSCSGDLSKEEFVNLLVLGNSIWGTLCEGCRKRYHSKLRVMCPPNEEIKEAARADLKRLGI